MPVTLYPAVDLRGGRAVRLLQGRADAETVYHDDPLEPARRFLAEGATWLHCVDLDGAFAGTPRNRPVVEALARLGLKVQLGGGLRDEAGIAAALDAGVTRAVVGTRAATDPAAVAALAARFGDRLAVGIDAKDGRVAVRGWVETVDLTAIDLARRCFDAGVRTFIYTDIATDGMLGGPNLAAQEALASAVPGASVIASGGVGGAADVAAIAALSRRVPGVAGVIVGKALYEGRTTVAELLRALG